MRIPRLSPPTNPGEWLLVLWCLFVGINAAIIILKELLHA